MKNLLKPKRDLVFKNAHRLFFDMLTSRGIQLNHSWSNIYSIQMHISVLFVNSSILFINQHLFFLHHIFHDKQSLLQFFVLHFKAVASQQYCQYFDVTRHIPNKPASASCLRPVRQPKNKGTAEFKAVVERHHIYRDDNIYNHNNISNMFYEMIW